MSFFSISSIKCLREQLQILPSLSRLCKTRPGSCFVDERCKDFFYLCSCSTECQPAWIWNSWQLALALVQNHTVVLRKKTTNQNQEMCFCRRQRRWVWQQLKRLKVGCSYGGIVLTRSCAVLLQWCLRKTGWRTCFRVTSFPIICSTFWQAQFSSLAVLLWNSWFPEQN